MTTVRTQELGNGNGGNGGPRAKVVQIRQQQGGLVAKAEQPEDNAVRVVDLQPLVGRGANILVSLGAGGERTVLERM